MKENVIISVAANWFRSCDPRNMDVNRPNILSVDGARHEPLLHKSLHFSGGWRTDAGHRILRMLRSFQGIPMHADLGTSFVFCEND